ncbi:methyltransferase domain-containing protein [Hymenobacter sp. H14-R3]|uniref:methyltransferase domain-containing protein n=1 Tax=Hymenobacter sp. H14-R3 TaxID=3046308 RepID=UPI0024B9B624|nr:methyltransferase domain-containing protein [Hymenobacter sp. H14-R3]MDJ0364466.1 methyltransferase domain-containing protein [Hymenobacter sp. H14-R3]
MTVYFDFPFFNKVTELLPVCPVCGSADLRDKLRVQDRSVSQETFTIQQCAACGFQLTNPRPSAATIGKYYESDAYVSHNSAAQGLVNRVYKAARYFTVRRKVRLITQLNGGHVGNLLDYGCGTGHFLAGAKRAGWQVTGLEPNDRARHDAAARVGQPILEDTALAALPAASFDVITLWHVLEHVHTLNDTLAQLLTALKPSGKLLIAVPNAESLDAQHYRQDWASYDVPRHLYHFVPATMRRLLAAHGLHVTQTLPLPLDAYYISMLSERNRAAERAGGPLAVLRAGYKSNQYAAQHGGQYSSLVYVAERAAAGR